MRVYSERLMREAMAEAVSEARDTAVLEGHFGADGDWEPDYADLEDVDVDWAA